MNAGQLLAALQQQQLNNGQKSDDNAYNLNLQATPLIGQNTPNLSNQFLLPNLPNFNAGVLQSSAAPVPAAAAPVQNRPLDANSVAAASTASFLKGIPGIPENILSSL